MSTFELLVTLLKTGFKITVQVTILSAIIAFFLGLITGLARISKYRVVRVIATLYVEIFRGTSLLVQLFWIYFALPIMGIRLPALHAGIIAIGLNFGAYCSEIVRSSILSVPEGQIEAI